MSSNEASRGLGAIAAAQGVVREFLTQALPDVRRVDITKMARREMDGGSWEAEADIWQPNPTIQALHLETERPVLDRQHYLVRLDATLNVIAYELGEAM